FFQSEDGIRDRNVTGVQTCALPICIDPPFAIGQRALFARSAGGNLLWDCVPLLDPAVEECFQALGGISAIAISHPHYYASMVQRSEERRVGKESRSRWWRLDIY